MFCSKLDKTNQDKSKRAPKRRSKNQKPTDLHTQESHKNTGLKATVYILRTLHRPKQALRLFLQSPCVHMNFVQLFKKVLFCWCPPIPPPPVSHTSPPPPWAFLRSEGRVLPMASCLELCVPIYNIFFTHSFVVGLLLMVP